MKKRLVKKGLVLTILLVFIGSSIVPNIGADIFATGGGKRDNIPPTCEITYPEDGGWVGGIENITGTAEDPDGWIVLVQVSFDEGATWVNATGAESWYYIWDTTQHPDYDFFVIQARAKDNNESYSDIDSVEDLILDNTKPYVEIDVPREGGFYIFGREFPVLSRIVPGTVVIGSINVEVEAIDPGDEPPHGVYVRDNVTFYINGRGWLMQWNIGKEKWEYHFSMLAFEKFTISASAWDKADNRGDSKEYEVLYFSLGI